MYRTRWIVFPGRVARAMRQRLEIKKMGTIENWECVLWAVRSLSWFLKRMLAQWTKSKAGIGKVRYKKQKMDAVVTPPRPLSPGGSAPPQLLGVLAAQDPQLPSFLQNCPQPSGSTLPERFKPPPFQPIQGLPDMGKSQLRWSEGHQLCGVSWSYPLAEATCPVPLPHSCLFLNASWSWTLLLGNLTQDFKLPLSSSLLTEGWLMLLTDKWQQLHPVSPIKQSVHRKSNQDTHGGHLYAISGLLGLDCSKNKICMALMGVVYNLTTVVCMGDTMKPSPGMDVGKKKKNRILSYYMNSNLPEIQTFPSKPHQSVTA